MDILSNSWFLETVLCHALLSSLLLIVYQIILVTINLYRKDLECEVHSEVSFINNKPIFPVHPEAILAVFFLIKLKGTMRAIPLLLR